MATDGGGHKLVVKQRATGLQEVSDLNLMALPLHFTLALPFGTAGWHPDLRTEVCFDLSCINSNCTTYFTGRQAADSHEVLRLLAVCEEQGRGLPLPDGAPVSRICHLRADDHRQQQADVPAHPPEGAQSGDLLQLEGGGGEEDEGGDIPKTFLNTKTQNFFGLKNFSDPNFFDPKRSSLVLWYKPTKPKSFEPKTYQAEHFRPKSCFRMS